MAVSARLSRTLHQRLGDEAAQDLVDWMGQMESNRSELRDVMDQYVARTDLRFAEFDARMDARFAESDARMDARFAESDARMNARFTESDGRMSAGFAASDVRFAEMMARMDNGFAQLEIRFERRFGDLMKWSFVFWCGAVGAIAALARVLG